MNIRQLWVSLLIVLVHQDLLVNSVKHVWTHSHFAKMIFFISEYFRCSTPGLFLDLYNCAQGSYFVCDNSSKNPDEFNWIESISFKIKSFEGNVQKDYDSIRIKCLVITAVLFHVLISENKERGREKGIDEKEKWCQ